MGRPGLTLHRKFKRLAVSLDSPAMARGVLELLWEAAYESGEDRVGSAADIAVAVGWKGAADDLAAALAGCGGEGCHGFVEAIPGEPGRYRIHDLYHHAPTYVQKRMEREADRVSRGQTISDVRRDAGKKGLESRRYLQMTATENQLQQTLASGPTPAPAPAPALKKDENPPQAALTHIPASTPTCPKDPILGTPAGKRQGQLVDRHRDNCIAILASLNTARKRVRPKCRPIDPRYSSLAGIAKCLEMGRTVEQFRHVIAVYENEVRNGNAATWDYFDAVSPWRPDNFERALAKETGGASDDDAYAESVRQAERERMPWLYEDEKKGDE